MFYRVLATAIVLFWVTMMGVLVRTELAPAQSRLSAVPPEHVLKLIFLHEQPSDLNIASGNLTLGRLRLAPSTDKSSQQKRLGLVGNLRLQLPRMPRQRFSWDGTLELDAQLKPERFHLTFTLQEPEFRRTEIELDAPQNRARFTMKNRDGTTLEQGEYTLDEAGARRGLAEAGVDPSLMGVLGQNARNQIQPVIEARQASLLIHGERVETYLLTLTQGGQTFLEAHVSQIGQILAVKTILGYTLTPEDVVP